MKPVFDQFGARLFHGDCIEVMRGLPDASVHAVVTDPPYGLGFMGRAWDDLPPGEEWARECLRVLKPGGHLLAFGGTRTWHRLAVAVEDAGFEIRDSIAWLYGSGFPKSLDVSKAIDKQRTEDLQPAADVARWLVERMELLGITRRDICDHFSSENIAQQWTTHWTDGAVKPRVPRWEQWVELRRWLDLPDDMDAEVWRLNGRKGKPGDNFEGREVLSERVSVVKGGSGGWSDMVASGRFKPGEKTIRETAPATPDAERWQGWGTALKPAFEPIVVGRKPLAGTVAGNVLQHGTGALNIDACRVEAGQDYRDKCASVVGLGSNTDGDAYGSFTRPREDSASPAGRWPTNVLLDDSQAAELDRQSGERPTPGVYTRGAAVTNKDAYGEGMGRRSEGDQQIGYGDTGGASRFFPTFRYEAKAPSSERPKVNGIAHPTVKPVDLMRWLVRLVTPPGGTLLEPFAGSGTTLEAALSEGFEVIGIEREADYLPLIEHRLARPITPALDLGEIA